MTLSNTQCYSRASETSNPILLVLFLFVFLEESMTWTRNQSKITFQSLQIKESLFQVKIKDYKTRKNEHCNTHVLIRVGFFSLHKTG